jgi:hypothetical protein
MQGVSLNDNYVLKKAWFHDIELWDMVHVPWPTIACKVFVGWLI